MHEKLKLIPTIPDQPENAPPEERMELWRDTKRGLSCFYAPFDYVNRDAKLILVGVTPGRTQMNLALNAARKAMRVGAPLDRVIRQVKRDGSFSGDMRSNIIAILDRLGYAHMFDLSSTAQLWGDRDDLVHFTSLLKYPVFINGHKFDDYNGSPNPKSVDALKEMLSVHFVAEMQLLPKDALLVPFGNTVLAVIERLKNAGTISQVVKAV